MMYAIYEWMYVYMSVWVCYLFDHALQVEREAREAAIVGYRKLLLESCDADTDKVSQPLR